MFNDNIDDTLKRIPSISIARCTMNYANELHGPNMQSDTK